MKISIITATFNAAEELPKLIKSLRSQTSSDFDWIVADGGSTDDTREIIKNNQDLMKKYIFEPDFGIYDALNKTIKFVETKYYLIMGADDILSNDAVANYCRAATHSDADFISAKVKTSDGKTLIPLNGNPLRFGHLAYISQHAVGTLINVNLHARVGLYSNRFPIAADRFFVRSAIEKFGARIQAEEFYAGIYSSEGVSSSRFYESLLDIFKVDYILSNHPKSMAIFCLLRYMANMRKM